MKALSWVVFIGCLWVLHRTIDGELEWPWLVVSVVVYVFVLGLRGDRERLYDARVEDRGQPGRQ